MGKRDNMNMKITTMLGEGSRVEGDFYVEGSARIEGTIIGNVKATGSLVLGNSAKITGDIEANSILIGGEVTGDAAAEEKLELAASARMRGNIVTKVLVIDEYAVFDGSCSMAGKE